MPIGPHTRNPRAAAAYRGSRKRIERLRPFEEMPLDFWLIIGIAATMLALTVAILYRAMVR